MRRAKPGSEMPFLDHLEELRWRLIWMIGALIVGFGVGFFLVVHFDLITVLARPVQPYLPTGKLVYLHPMDVLTNVTMLSFAAGLVVALPVILYQLWAFVAPALWAKEKRVAVWVFAGGMILFLLGVALSYFFVVPATLRFNASLQGEGLEAMISVGDYFSFIVVLALTFGVAFELPILILGLTALGLVTPTFLRKYRRHALVLCAAAAAVLTPGDAVTATVLLLGPLYLLYELGILLSSRAYRWRQRRENSIGATDEAPETA